MGYKFNMRFVSSFYFFNVVTMWISYFLNWLGFQVPLADFKHYLFIWICLDTINYLYYYLINHSIHCNLNYSSIFYDCRFYYFIVQAMGTLVFMYGVRYDFNNYMWMQAALYIKIGVFPFLWWLQYYCNHMSLFAMFFNLTMCKFLPMELTKTFSCYKTFVFSVLMINIVVGFMGVMYSFFMSKDIKRMISWGALMEQSFFIFLSIGDYSHHPYFSVAVWSYLVGSLLLYNVLYWYSKYSSPSAIRRFMSVLFTSVAMMLNSTRVHHFGWILGMSEPYNIHPYFYYIFVLIPLVTKYLIFWFSIKKNSYCMTGPDIPKYYTLWFLLYLLFLLWVGMVLCPFLTIWLITVQS